MRSLVPAQDITYLNTYGFRIAVAFFHPIHDLHVL